MLYDAAFHALFVINDHGIIQKVNKTSSTVFGWTEEEFIGSNISMIMTSDVGRQHDQYLANYLRTGVKKMIGTSREVIAQRKDKSTFPSVLGLSQIEDGSGLFCGFIRDISFEKAAHKHMEDIINASFDALFCINEKGLITQINDAASRVFGWTKEEFIGQNITMIMPEGHARKVSNWLSSIDIFVHNFQQPLTLSFLAWIAA